MLEGATRYFELMSSINGEFIHIQYLSDTAKPQCAIILQVHPNIGDKHIYLKLNKYVEICISKYSFNSVTKNTPLLNEPCI